MKEVESGEQVVKIVSALSQTNLIETSQVHSIRSASEDSPSKQDVQETINTHT